MVDGVANGSTGSYGSYGSNSSHSSYDSYGTGSSSNDSRNDSRNDSIRSAIDSSGGAANDSLSTSDESSWNGTTTMESFVSSDTTADALSDRSAAVNDTSAADTSANDGFGFYDAAKAGAQGLAAFTAREGIGAASARNGYEQAVSQLNPADTAGRTAAKINSRAATPPVTRAVIEAIRPDLGPRAGSVASANKSNLGANRLAGTLGKVGRGAAVVGVALGAARIATAENKVEEAVLVAGGAVGGIAAGALVGAQLGALGANPITIAAGAVVGGIVGGIAGEAAVGKAMDWAKSLF